MELSKRTVIIFVISCVAIILLPIGFYLYNFIGYRLSDTPSDWGVLGDYIGGILNPFIAILNILLLVYITVYVDKQDHKKMFNQFRYDAYLEFSRLLNSFNPNNTTTTIEETKNLYMEIERLQFVHQFLFEGKDNKTYQVLLGTMLNIISVIETYVSTYEKQKKEMNEKSNIFEQFRETTFPQSNYLLKNFEKYPLQRQIFIGFMQRVIANGDRVPYENWDIDKFLEEHENKQKI